MFNPKNISKTIVLCLGVLIMSFLVGYLVFAWNEPTQAPPGCTSGQPGCDAPINVGSATQDKTGWFTFEGGGTRNSTFLATQSGNVGIGTTTPVAGFILDSNGSVRVGGNLRVTSLVNCNTIDTDAAGNLSCGTDETGAGGGAPTDASYVAMGLNGTLTAERVLTAGTGISITDGGANGNVTITNTVSIPSGAVMSFNLSSCPSGWSELVAARGRYLVGLPSGGTLAGTTGTALSNLENRAVGQHSHGVTDPGHYHTIAYDYGTPMVMWNQVVRDNVDATQGRYSASVTTGITIDNAGSIAGTNAPYIQLLVCQKD